MAELTIGANPALDHPGRWISPALPTGIDHPAWWVETGLTPTINTGIAQSRSPGVGQVGAGIVKAPLKCFEDALVAFAETMGRRNEPPFSTRSAARTYLDSIVLMRISRQIAALPGGPREAGLFIGHAGPNKGDFARCRPFWGRKARGRRPAI